MSRDQRVRDNHGLLHARALSRELGQPLEVAFCLMPRSGAASRRSYDFMLDSLDRVEADLRGLGIPFRLLNGEPSVVLAPHLAQAGAVVCDFNPLRRPRTLRTLLAERLTCPLVEVDSRNVVPAWIAADKRITAARFLRSRHLDLLPLYLAEIEPLEPQSGAELPDPVDWESARRSVLAPDHGPPITLAPGEDAAADALARFIAERLPGYAERRGLANEDHSSRLSAYLHFGQISMQRVALTVRNADAPSEDIESFLDEAITWRELADNFCLYTDRYAELEGMSDWARETLTQHADDPREVVYDLDAFESADTHDPLWNAAQFEMVRTGRMHNYMRMYWAKKILEWSESPAEAMRIATLLNDRYELDGRESNGYAGIAWAIGGMHDRGWPERSVYGKIRYMNANGARRKFDVDGYIRRVAPELLDAQLF